jgi:hypothetical protein
MRHGIGFALSRRATFRCPEAARSKPTVACLAPVVSLLVVADTHFRCCTPRSSVTDLRLRPSYVRGNSCHKPIDTVAQRAYDARASGTDLRRDGGNTQAFGGNRARCIVLLLPLFA